mmetsp:Transcript_76517/g.149966  ORF Transcript_76517/g.149966 Transcript_76517/m.149966 type:complete len:336 (+) Transcript_76517:858-1865(+)
MLPSSDSRALYRALSPLNCRVTTKSSRPSTNPSTVTWPEVRNSAMSSLLSASTASFTWGICFPTFFPREPKLGAALYTHHSSSLSVTVTPSAVSSDLTMFVSLVRPLSCALVETTTTRDLTGFFMETLLSSRAFRPNSTTVWSAAISCVSSVAAAWACGVMFGSGVGSWRKCTESADPKSSWSLVGWLKAGLKTRSFWYRNSAKKGVKGDTRHVTCWSTQNSTLSPCAASSSAPLRRSRFSLTYHFVSWSKNATRAGITVYRRYACISWCTNAMSSDTSALIHASKELPASVTAEGRNTRPLAPACHRAAFWTMNRNALYQGIMTSRSTPFTPAS